MIFLVKASSNHEKGAVLFTKRHACFNFVLKIITRNWAFSNVYGNMQSLFKLFSHASQVCSIHLNTKSLHRAFEVDTMPVTKRLSMNI